MVKSSPLPKMSGVYTITSAVNGRVYVGSAVDIKDRWKSHRTHLRRGTHRNRHLQRAWDKYGEDEFEFAVLEECASELLIEREQWHMDQQADKYNLNPIAGSRLGATQSPESRAKIREANLGKILSPEHKAKIGASHLKLERKISDEHREIIREANRKRVVSDETRAKMRASSKERWDRERTAKSKPC